VVTLDRPGGYAKVLIDKVINSYMFEKMIISILKFLKRITVLSRLEQKLLLSPNSLEDGLDGNLSTYWLAQLYSMKKNPPKCCAHSLPTFSGGPQTVLQTSNILFA
jgi:hypothetical protein